MGKLKITVTMRKKRNLKGPGGESSELLGVRLGECIQREPERYLGFGIGKSSTRMVVENIPRR